MRILATVCCLKTTTQDARQKCHSRVVIVSAIAFFLRALNETQWKFAIYKVRLSSTSGTKLSILTSMCDVVKKVNRFLYIGLTP